MSSSSPRSRLRRFGSARALLCMTLLVPLLAAIVVGSPAPAQARCNGYGNELTSTLNVGYGVLEIPSAGTCNSNGFYDATISPGAGAGPGTCASVYIQNGGTWFYGGGHCGPGWGNVSYSDANSNTLMVLCYLDQWGTQYCGWGSQVLQGNYYAAASAGYYGNNWGY